MKPKHKCHKQLSTDLETAFHNKDFADVKVFYDHDYDTEEYKPSMGWFQFLEF